jgi:hypothetical protein
LKIGTRVRFAVGRSDLEGRYEGGEEGGGSCVDGLMRGWGGKRERREENGRSGDWVVILLRFVELQVRVDSGGC